ncbi:MAG: ADP-ribosylglycohydrolase family protein [Phycisphaerae bacterium]|nr:ADP-ribosylglycohydrolase family protein [Phycisphaerae bacterium]
MALSQSTELGKLVAQLNDWMFQAHDQGVNIHPAVKPALAALRRAVAELRKAKPRATIVANEPNALAAIHSRRPVGPRRLWERFDPKLYAEKVRGAYLARAAGCTLGAIVEFNSIEQMEGLAAHAGQPMPPEDYWAFTNNPWHKRYLLSPCEDYTRGRMNHVPVDDDLTYTLLGLLILEDSGVHFTTADVGKAWLKYLPVACTAEHVALENLKKGVSWKRAGEKDNPYVEWIGADIRSDPWGYAAPGWPAKAAELAWRDAFLSHRFGGIYGEMYFAAVIAAAFAVDDPMRACEIGLGEIPRRCRVAEGIRWGLNMAETVKDYRHARQLVDEKFHDMHGVHTINNACLTIFGLALGGRDVTKVIGNTVAMGLDNDCTAATAGSIVGAVVGAKAIPAHWTRPFKGKIRTYMTGQEWFTIDDVVARFGAVAKQVWETDAVTE